MKFKNSNHKFIQYYFSAVDMNIPILHSTSHQ